MMSLTNLSLLPELAAVADDEAVVREDDDAVLPVRATMIKTFILLTNILIICTYFQEEIGQLSKHHPQM